MHAPVRRGECLSCHKPHGANGRFLLDSGVDRTSLCLGCHDKISLKRKFTHGPVAEGSCTACHDPHESAEKYLLKSNSRELCLKCHDDFAQAMKSAARIHPPVKEKPCTSCHDPHGSDYRYLLKEKMPDLCISCHKGIGVTLKTSSLVHKPVVDGKGCGNCHSTHFAQAKGLLAGGEQALCTGCHGGDAIGQTKLRNIKQELSGEKTLHGPIRNGVCRGCHDPHASNYPKLLMASYPDTFYAPFTEHSYDLCLTCHNKNLLHFPETTLYTKFRNGDRNLHYVHVVDSRKGHSCRACHESHAADGPMLTNTKGMRFGQWMVATRFQPTATGGSCAPGCHKRYSYDRKVPVVYDAKPQGSGSAGAAATPPSVVTPTAK